MVVPRAEGRGDGGGGTIDLAWIITPHGLGHAARASAIIDATSGRMENSRHHLLTTVPREFFDDSLRDVDWTYREFKCDVGMVQRNPFEEDVEATIEALDRLWLQEQRGLDDVVSSIAQIGCRLIVCDIAPLGLAIANRLAVPGVLVENFTWDWIYRAYGDHRLDAHGDRLSDIFDSAVLRIQTEPVCRRSKAARVVPPVSRNPQKTRTEVRAALGIPDGHRMVLLSVSGLESASLDCRGFRSLADTTLVAPGVRGEKRGKSGLVRTEVFGGPYHPDLVAASDLVIGKLGYSTIAEVYQAGTAFAYLRRPRFPESPILEAIVREYIPSEALSEDWLENPSVPALLEDLLTRLRPTGIRPNGAGEAANLILNLLQHQF